MQLSPSSDSRSSALSPLLVACRLGICITLLLYSPGYMSRDSLDQLKQARSGVLRDNHPPVVAVIWSILDRISSGLFGMLLLQTILHWSGLAVFFACVDGRTWGATVCLLVLGFFPPIFAFDGTIWVSYFIPRSSMKR